MHAIILRRDPARKRDAPNVLSERVAHMEQSGVGCPVRSEYPITLVPRRASVV